LAHPGPESGFLGQGLFTRKLLHNEILHPVMPRQDAMAIPTGSVKWSFPVNRKKKSGRSTNQDIKKAGSSGKEPASLKGEKRMMILFLLAYCCNGCANKNKKPEN
ncbi:MAG: hypothetical protein ABR523_11880, partial [Desulfurivibrionaceae bacterium]